MKATLIFFAALTGLGLSAPLTDADIDAALETRDLRSCIQKCSTGAVAGSFACALGVSNKSR